MSDGRPKLGKKDIDQVFMLSLLIDRWRTQFDKELKIEWFAIFVCMKNVDNLPHCTSLFWFI